MIERLPVKRLTNGLEKELERCEKTLSKKFKPVFSIIPTIEKKEIFYGGILFKTNESKARKLQVALREKSAKNGIPGRIVLYKSHEQDSYYIIELKPHTAKTTQDLIENTRQIANYLATFLKKFY